MSEEDIKPKIRKILEDGGYSVPVKDEDFTTYLIENPEKRYKIRGLVQGLGYAVATNDKDWDIQLGLNTPPQKKSPNESQTNGGEDSQTQSKQDFNPLLKNTPKRAIEIASEPEVSRIPEKKLQERKQKEYNIIAEENRKRKELENLSTIDKINNNLSSFNKGAIDIIPSAIETAGEISYTVSKGIEDALGLTPNPLAYGRELSTQPIYQIGEKTRDIINKTFPVNDTYSETIIPQISNGLGQAIPSLVAAFVSGGTTAIKDVATKMPFLKSVATKLMSSAKTGAINAPTIFSNIYKEAIANGASPYTAFTAGIINTAGSTLASGLVMDRAFDKMDKASNGLFKKTLLKKLQSGTIGTIEGATGEAVEQVLENVVAKNSYDESRNFIDGVVESAKVGGGTSLVINVLIAGLGGRVKKAKTETERNDAQKALDYANQQSSNFENNANEVENQAPQGNEPPQTTNGEINTPNVENGNIQQPTPETQEVDTREFPVRYAEVKDKIDALNQKPIDELTKEERATYRDDKRKLIEQITALQNEHTIDIDTKINNAKTVITELQDELQDSSLTDIDIADIENGITNKAKEIQSLEKEKQQAIDALNKPKVNNKRFPLANPQFDTPQTEEAKYVAQKERFENNLVARGNETAIVMADGSQRKAQYIAIQDDGITTSHDPNTQNGNGGFAENPNFPTENDKSANDRESYTTKEGADKERARANAFDTQLAYDLGQKVDAIPTVDDVGFTKSGNGRLSAHRIHNQTSKNKAKTLADMKELATKVGIDPNLVNENTRIVRQDLSGNRISTDEMGLFNPEGSGKSKSAKEIATSISRKKNLPQIQEALYLVKSNVDKVKVLLETNLIDKDKIDDYLEPKTNKLTEKGENLLNTVELANTVNESALESLNNGTKPMNAFKKRINKAKDFINSLPDNFNIKQALSDAIAIQEQIESDSSLDDSPNKLQQYLAQRTIDDIKIRNSDAVNIYNMLQSDDFLAKMEQFAGMADSNKAVDLFGIQPMTKSEILNQISGLDKTTLQFTDNNKVDNTTKKTEVKEEEPKKQEAKPKQSESENTTEKENPKPKETSKPVEPKQQDSKEEKYPDNTEKQKTESKKIEPPKVETTGKIGQSKFAQTAVDHSLVTADTKQFINDKLFYEIGSNEKNIQSGINYILEKGESVVYTEIINPTSNETTLDTEHVKLCAGIVLIRQYDTLAKQALLDGDVELCNQLRDKNSKILRVISQTGTKAGKIVNVLSLVNDLGGVDYYLPKMVEDAQKDLMNAAEIKPDDFIGLNTDFYVNELKDEIVKLKEEFYKQTESLRNEKAILEKEMQQLKDDTQKQLENIEIELPSKLPKDVVKRKERAKQAKENIKNALEKAFSKQFIGDNNPINTISLLRDVQDVAYDYLADFQYATVESIKAHLKKTFKEYNKNFKDEYIDDLEREIFGEARFKIAYKTKSDRDLIAQTKKEAKLKALEKTKSKLKTLNELYVKNEQKLSDAQKNALKAKDVKKKIIYEVDKFNKKQAEGKQIVKKETFAEKLIKNLLDINKLSDLPEAEQKALFTDAYINTYVQIQTKSNFDIAFINEVKVEAQRIENTYAKGSIMYKANVDKLMLKMRNKMPSSLAVDIRTLYYSGIISGMWTFANNYIEGKKTITQKKFNAFISNKLDSKDLVALSNKSRNEALINYYNTLQFGTDREIENSFKALTLKDRAEGLSNLINSDNKALRFIGKTVKSVFENNSSVDAYNTTYLDNIHMALALNEHFTKQLRGQYFDATTNKRIQIGDKNKPIIYTDKNGNKIEMSFSNLVKQKVRDCFIEMDEKIRLDAIKQVLAENKTISEKSEQKKLYKSDAELEKALELEAKEKNITNQDDIKKYVNNGKTLLNAIKTADIKGFGNWITPTKTIQGIKRAIPISLTDNGEISQEVRDIVSFNKRVNEVILQKQLGNASNMAENEQSQFIKDIDDDVKYLSDVAMAKRTKSRKDASGKEHSSISGLFIHIFSEWARANEKSIDGNNIGSQTSGLVSEAIRLRIQPFAKTGINIISQTLDVTPIISNFKLGYYAQSRKDNQTVWQKTKTFGAGALGINSTKNYSLRDVIEYRGHRQSALIGYGLTSGLTLLYQMYQAPDDEEKRKKMPFSFKITGNQTGVERKKGKQLLDRYGYNKLIFFRYGKEVNINGNQISMPYANSVGFRMALNTAQILVDYNNQNPDKGLSESGERLVHGLAGIGLEFTGNSANNSISEFIKYLQNTADNGTETKKILKDVGVQLATPATLLIPQSNMMKNLSNLAFASKANNDAWDKIQASIPALNVYTKLSGSERVAIDWLGNPVVQISGNSLNAGSEMVQNIYKNIRLDNATKELNDLVLFTDAIPKDPSKSKKYIIAKSDDVDVVKFSDFDSYDIVKKARTKFKDICISDIKTLKDIKKSDSKLRTNQLKDIKKSDSKLRTNQLKEALQLVYDKLIELELQENGILEYSGTFKEAYDNMIEAKETERIQKVLAK